MTILSCAIRSTLWASLLAVAFAVGCKASIREPLCRGCNVLLVSMDTLRADRLGAYGNNRPTSPNIDAFAARSVLFENAVSQAAWTRPAHASMFTGLYPLEHGILAMNRTARLPDVFPTLAETLSEAGYDTAAFTGGANMSVHFGFERGFDLYRSPGRRLENQLEAVDRWLSARGREPWFLFVHGFDPHRPYKSLSEDRIALGLPAEVPPGIKRACRERDTRAVGALIAEYDAAVHRGDRSFGRLLALLRSHGFAENTIVLFTSDHGEEFLEHGRCYHIKSLYREVVDVPLVISVPGIEPRRVAGVVPASTAVTPTILELVGAKSVGIDGPSLAAVLAGAPPAFGYVVSETSSRYAAPRGHGHVRALTGDTEKLVHWISRGRYEYFDLTADPRELRPLPSPRIDVLRRRLGRWVRAHPPRVGELPEIELPEHLRRQLRRLGYID